MEISNRALAWTLGILAVVLVVVPLLGMIGMMGMGGTMMGGIMGLHRPASCGCCWQSSS
jgi:hypothetical protein